jgi:hypothetical protein
MAWNLLSFYRFEIGCGAQPEIRFSDSRLQQSAVSYQQKRQQTFNHARFCELAAAANL